MTPKQMGRLGLFHIEEEILEVLSDIGAADKLPEVSIGNCRRAWDETPQYACDRARKNAALMLRNPGPSPVPAKGELDPDIRRTIWIQPKLFLG